MPTDPRRFRCYCTRAAKPCAPNGEGEGKLVAPTTRGKHLEAQEAYVQSLGPNPDRNTLSAEDQGAILALHRIRAEMIHESAQPKPPRQQRRSVQLSATPSVMSFSEAQQEALQAQEQSLALVNDSMESGESSYSQASIQQRALEPSGLVTFGPSASHLDSMLAVPALLQAPRPQQQRRHPFQETRQRDDPPAEVQHDPNSKVEQASPHQWSHQSASVVLNPQASPHPVSQHASPQAVDQHTPRRTDSASRHPTPTTAQNADVDVNANVNADAAPLSPRSREAHTPTFLAPEPSIERLQGEVRAQWRLISQLQHEAMQQRMYVASLHQDNAQLHAAIDELRQNRMPDRGTYTNCTITFS